MAKLFHIEESDIYNQFKTQTCYELSLIWIFCDFLTRSLTRTHTNYFFIDLSLESVFNALHDFNETLVFQAHLVTLLTVVLCT